MRLRLVHQLSLLLSAIVVLVVLAMAALLGWNLRAGFADYLREQDAQVLDRLMIVAEADLQRRGGPPPHWGPALRDWLDSTATSLGRRLAPPERRRPPATGQWPGGGAGLADERLPPRAGDDRPPPRPPPRGDPANFGGRLVLLDADARHPLVGREDSLQRPGQLRAIKLDGRTYAVLRLAEREGPGEGVDAQFLSRQYLGIAGIGAALIVLALFAARWLAQRWLRPLQAAQAAAREIAKGRLEARAGTDAAHGDDELGELNRDIDAMAASLARLESSRRRWIAELSHELRTPLAVLRGELEALADGIRPWDAAARLSLQDEVLRLASLIDDFHTLALSDLRELPCSFGPTDVPALLAEALARAAPRAAGRGLTLERDWTDALPPAASVHWDARRIAQLLANLLENSLRYTDVPGRVRVGAHALGAAIEITVEDSAPGVPAEALPHLFDPLYRVESSRSRDHGGSGLGLAIAQAIARSHGAKLVAEPSPLGGLAMRIAVPLRPQERT